MNIIFASSDSISFETINALGEHLKCLVAPPSRPKGRGNKISPPETVEYVQKKYPNLPIIQTENINLEIEKLSAYKPDAILVFSFAQFFKKELLNRFPVFNIHTSLLPKYRGASPIQAALLNNDSTTGVCIQRMQLKLDTGPILCEKSIPIEAHDNYTSLSIKLGILAGELTENFISLGPIFPPGIEQNESNKSYAGLIKKEDAKIILSDSRRMAFGKIRAFNEWPVAWIEIDGSKFKILRAKKINQHAPAGELIAFDKQLLLGFSEGALEIFEIQPESKPKMDAASFINGYRRFLGRSIC